MLCKHYWCRLKHDLKKWQRQEKITNSANWKDSIKILLLCAPTKYTENCNMPLNCYSECTAQVWDFILRHAIASNINKWIQLFSQILLLSVFQKSQTQIFKILLKFLQHWEASHRLRSLLDIYTAVLLLSIFISLNF